MWFAFLGSLFGLLASGVWIGVALGVTAIIVMHFWGPGLTMLGSATWNALNVYSLTALPGFIFMGQVLFKSGLSVKVYSSITPLMARLPGKLLHANILISAIFAAVLGSSTANAALVGSVAIPELRKRKYDKRLLLGTVGIGGTLGLMIPPSAGFIIYGVMSGTSIAALFAAGTIPGIILALLYSSYIGVKGKITPNIAPLTERRLPLKETLLSLVGIWPIIILMFVCVGTIYLGWCTPAEAAGIGAAASIITGRLFGKLRWQEIKEALTSTTEITAMIFFLILGAMLFSVSIMSIGLPRAIVHQISQFPLSNIQILLLIYLMYMIMGCFMDGVSITVATLPFMVPVAVSLGLDLVWFGVVFTMVLEAGSVTPPVGLNLFVVQGIAGPDTSISDVALGAAPFVLITMGVLVFITIFPEIALLLPRLLGLH